MFDVLLRVSQVDGKAEQYHMLYWCFGTYITHLAVLKYQGMLYRVLQEAFSVSDPVGAICRQLWCCNRLTDSIFARH